ncbi:MAG: acyl-CoA dehydrogenase family protein [Pseudomonadales bacterium]|mgnify:FL=1|jgi:alkylation response protein AidB-like acyl-CoA dehydrogenase|tara:strand:+ start:4368 stop:5513 length:1146 start_codon:yes stop_codon:yes gene_type:complete
MDMTFPPDTDAFRDEVRAFFANDYPKNLLEKTARGEPLSKQDYQQSEQALSEKGWLCVNWPDENGGPGWDVTKKFIYDQELEGVGAISPVPMGVIYVGPVIVAFGTDEQKARWLPGIQQSTTFWAQGYSEPGSGSDLASLQCKAERDGDDYIVTGTKIWTSLAQHADWIFALVRTSHEDVKQQGITFLCAPMDSPGIEVHPIITIDGRHSLNRVTFDNVRVPVHNRIGDEGQGWKYANFLLGNERTSYAHVAGKRMQMAAIEQFLESIDEQEYHARFNELSVRLDSLDITVLRVLATLANGASPGNESSILKIMATELAQDITELGMVVRQYAGIASFSEQMPDPAAAKATVDYLGTRSQSIYGGSNEIQKNIIAKRVLGL